MAFNGFGTKKEQPIDDTRHLLCTEPGCGQRWTVNLGKPMCSYHQWKDDKPYVYSQYHDFGKKYEGDPKGWAKRILEKQEMGLPVSKIALEFAKEVTK
jgi:hypothetical protein